MLKKKNTILVSIFLMLNLGLQSQARLNIDSISNFKFLNPSIINTNEVWGHVDSNGTEYALVGRGNGFSVISLAVPTNPQLVYSDTSALSLWRDIKTHKGYAYVVNEDRGGLEIFDLNGLPDTVRKVNSFGGDTFNLQRAHNLYIDSNGVAYIFGSNNNFPNSAGTIFLDVDTDPEKPIELGNYDSLYLHDGYVRDDTLYGGAVNNGKLLIIDVHDKQNPVLLGSITTPSAFTHNVWLSDDGNTAFTTDEVSGAYITAYDVSNPNLIIERDRIRSRNTSTVIPHNTHVLNDFLVTSYYTSGLSIIDATNPDILIETAYFDTSPNFSGSGFNGNWGAYPFLPSGLVLATDMEEGLFVLQPNYTRASFLDVLVRDCAGNAISSASITLNENLNATTNLIGRAEIGALIDGNFDLLVKAAGYYPETISDVEMRPGQTERLVISLRDSSLTFDLNVTDDQQNPISNAQYSMKNEDTLIQGTTDQNGQISLGDIDFGLYEFRAGKWAYKTVCLEQAKFNCKNTSITLILDEGIKDNFELDLGWTVSGNDSAGAWLRAEPIGTVDQIKVANPAVDSYNDCGNMAFVTGNGFGSADDFDVDSTTILKSPKLDLSGFIEPYLVFYRWFYNGVVLDDNMVVSFVDTSGNNLWVDFYTQENPNSNWVLENIKVSEHISPPALDYIQFEVSDNGSASILEAAIDQFFVSEGEFIGIEEQESANNYNIYPNPFNSIINIELASNDYLRSEIYDVSGRIIQSKKLTRGLNTLELDELPKGVYLLRLTKADGSFEQEKLIRQ